MSSRIFPAAHSMFTHTHKRLPPLATHFSTPFYSRISPTSLLPYFLKFTLIRLLPPFFHQTVLFKVTKVKINDEFYPQIRWQQSSSQMITTLKHSLQLASQLHFSGFHISVTTSQFIFLDPLHYSQHPNVEVPYGGLGPFLSPHLHLW